jgi:hypothetical protein
MRIADLLVDPDRGRGAPPPESDALTEDGALAETALLDLRLDLTTSDLWLLFDCRGALQLRNGNAAVIVINKITKLSWEAERRERRTWRAVIGWSPSVEPGRLTIVVDAVPGGRLELTGSGGEFFVGNIPGGDEPPPDFTSTTGAEIRSGLADWSSEFEIVGASVLTCSTPEDRCHLWST